MIIMQKKKVMKTCPYCSYSWTPKKKKDKLNKNWKPKECPNCKRRLNEVKIVRKLLPELTCMRCNYVWNPLTKKRPKLCPRCKSRAWDKDYKETSDFLKKRNMKGGELNDLVKIRAISR